MTFQLRYLVRWKRFILLFLVIGSSHTQGAVYYLDNLQGNDDNEGQTAESPWRSLDHAKLRPLFPGDRLLLRRGSTWDESLELRYSGSQASPIVVGAYGDGLPPRVESVYISSNHLILEDIIVDHNKKPGDAIRISESSHISLRHVTARYGTSDGIDIQNSRNIVIQNSLIHHFLGGSFIHQADAHGVVATNTRWLKLQDTEIHHVSGDSFQTDPARNGMLISNDIVIRDCHFWTGPLIEDFNSGWKKTAHLREHERQYPGENAIDTKVAKSNWQAVPRMRILVENLIVHGWKSDNYIRNKAAFNFKEKIEATVVGAKVFDNEIAFRIRGNRGNANVSIKNCMITHSEKAFRIEDNLYHLQITDSYLGSGIQKMLEISGGKSGQKSWLITNNTFVGSKPKVASDPSNRVIRSDSPKK